MYRFTTFDTDEFMDAIEAKKYTKIKSFIVSAIRNNPEFRKAPGQDMSEVKLALKILEERAKDIFEKYEIQEGEHPYDENEADQWDNEYFIRQTYLLERNFSKMRIKNLKKIGRKIANFQEPQEQKGNALRQSIADRRNNRLQNRWVTVGGIVVLILLLAVLVVNLMAIK